jgi:hypothetical protein
MPDADTIADIRQARGRRTDIKTVYTELFYERWDCWDGCPPGPHECNSIRSYPVTKVTPKRIYFDSNIHWRSIDDPHIHFVDRSVIERDGSIYHDGVREILHLKDTQLKLKLARPPKPSVSELRRRAADSHPDRGGDPAEFRAAYQEYERAKRAPTY